MIRTWFCSRAFRPIESLEIRREIALSRRRGFLRRAVAISAKMNLDRFRESVFVKSDSSSPVLAIIVSVMMLGSHSDAAKTFSVDSIIHLRKNTNNNQVHYAVRVDDACRPLSKNPIRAYWRMLEIGENETENLRFWEQPGYGVTQPERVHLGETNGYFDFRIRGVPERLIRVESFRTNGECRARASTNIADGRAIFEYIVISVSGWANIHRVEIFGISSDGENVSEITFQED